MCVELIKTNGGSTTRVFIEVTAGKYLHIISKHRKMEFRMKINLPYILQFSFLSSRPGVNYCILKISINKRRLIFI